MPVYMLRESSIKRGTRNEKYTVEGRYATMEHCYNKAHLFVVQQMRLSEKKEYKVVNL